MKSRRYSLLFALILLLATLSLIPLVATSGSGATFADLAKLGRVPDFTLTDQSGKPFSLEDLKGKVWVADFFLTTCQGACPIMSGNMRKLESTYANDERVRFVSITVDPENDTPDALSVYAQSLKVNSDRWHFLTGPINEIHRLESPEGFKVGVPESPLAHSQRFILIDRHGNIRGYYEAMEDAGVERVKHDINVLLAEKA